VADITITIPDTVLTMVVDALCEYGDWTAGDGNRSAFAKTVMIRWVKKVVVAREARIDGNVAVATAESDTTSELSGIV